MIILKALGAFFVKIWRWIKETAWVQPLLIVGAIFAIIFSIPSLTSWVNSWGLTSEGAYFNSKKETLEGEKDYKEANGELITNADKITDSIYKNMELIGQDKVDQIDTSSYGEKFFLIYTKSDNETSNKAESGLKYLSDNWGDLYIPTAANGTSFSFYSIFTDEESSNDDDYDQTDIDDKAFYRYLNCHLSFFNGCYDSLYAAPYRTNKSVADTNYENFSTPNNTSFPTPSILLVDYTKTAIDAGRAGVSEALFDGVTGENEATRATLLFNMWNHCADEVANPFSKKYSA